MLMIFEGGLLTCCLSHISFVIGAILLRAAAASSSCFFLASASALTSSVARAFNSRLLRRLASFSSALFISFFCFWNHNKMKLIKLLFTQLINYLSLHAFTSDAKPNKPESKFFYYNLPSFSFVSSWPFSSFSFRHRLRIDWMTLQRQLRKRWMKCLNSWICVSSTLTSSFFWRNLLKTVSSRHVELAKTRCCLFFSWL